MRLWILGAISAVLTVLGYLIWHETDHLALIEQTAEPTRLTLFDIQSFVLPEPKKITNKDKTTTEVFNAEDIANAYQKAKKDYAFYLAYEKEIYTKLIISFSLVALFFTVIGGLIGYWFRKPIDKFDFQSLKNESEQKIEIAQEQMRKAQEKEEKAWEKALTRARAELDHEQQLARNERNEAEQERRLTIQLQKKANEDLAMVQELRQSRTAAIVAADRRKAQIEKQKNIIRILKEKLMNKNIF